MEFIGIPLHRTSNRVHGLLIMACSLIVMGFLYAVSRDAMSMKEATPLMAGFPAALFSIAHGCTYRHMGWRGPLVVCIFTVIAMFISLVPFAFIK